MVNANKSKNRVRALWELKTWIRMHLDRVPPIDVLAARAGMSTRTFHRLFSEITGAPPAEYIQRLRLSHGAFWLIYSPITVIEAALAAGYDSREAFTRQFKKQYGCTPIELRSELQQHARSKEASPVPKGLRILKQEKLPRISLAACPHLGTPLSSLPTWETLDSRKNSSPVISPPAYTATLFYDDALIHPPHIRARYDAAFISKKSLPLDHTKTIIQHTLPAGLYVTAKFAGTLLQLEAAWKYFAVSWFLNRGLQIRDNRFLTFYTPHDISKPFLHSTCQAV